MYAEIAIHVPVPNTFHYAVPPALAPKLRVGQMVQVPFRTKAEHGILVRLSDTRPAELPEGVALKPIEALLHPQPVINPQQMALAAWIAAHYACSLAAALWLCLPPGFTGGRDILITLLDAKAPAQNMFEHRIISILLKRGALRGTQLNSALNGEKKQNWLRVVEQLAERGVLEITPVLKPPRIKPKRVETALLAISPQEIDGVLPTLGKRSRRADILEMLASLGEGVHAIKPLAELLGTTPATVKKLVDEGLATRHDDGIALAIAPEAVPQTLVTLRKGERQAHVLRVLARETVPMDVSWIYTQTDATLADLHALEERGYIILGERTDWRDTTAAQHRQHSQALTLTPQQQAACNEIIAALDSNQHTGFLLHGVTGSGKTEIYLQAIAHALKQGKTALFLVPEIALTPQTTARVAGRFAGRVTVLHSGLSDSERYDAWRRAREGLVQVVVGARSALFAPLANIGIIVLDEEHDPSYKQSPNVTLPPFRSAPHYHARAAAQTLAAQHGAVLVLGSATPALESMYSAERNGLHYINLPQRVMGHSADGEQPADGHPLPSIELVDMRAELKVGNISMFSGVLQQALAEVLARKQQALLLLNRRGKNTYVFCRDCGYVANCPDCDMPLTYHTEGVLRCHRCGHHSAPPTVCPVCSSQRIRYFGAGTQEVAQTLIKQFPRARVVRWDADTATDANTHAEFLQQFQQQQADVMVGTQMIAKGLDLPLVTLVGVISADTALNLPDYRAAERTFQLLTQVAGRAGRSMHGGRVILQTYQPEHYAIRAASAHDYERFYTQELAHRRRLGYPPFRRLVRFLCRAQTLAQAQQDAEHIAEQLVALLSPDFSGTEVIGPASCFYSKIGGYFRWHVLLRGQDPTPLLAKLTLPAGCYVDIDPQDIL